MTPILLTDEQQRFVEQRLATFLAQEYSIENQSNGKMTYAAAFIMGFDNHHQREASIPREKAPVDFKSNPWPSRHITGDGDIAEKLKNTLIASGWSLLSADDDYITWESRFIYQSEIGMKPRLTLNLRMIIDIDEKCLHFVVGQHTGDEFIERLTWVMSTPAFFPPWARIKSELRRLREKDTSTEAQSFLNAVNDSHAGTLLWREYGIVVSSLQKLL